MAWASLPATLDLPHGQWPGFVQQGSSNLEQIQEEQLSKTQSFHAKEGRKPVSLGFLLPGTTNANFQVEDGSVIKLQLLSR